MVEKITLILNENLAVKSNPFTTIPCTNPLQTAERSFFPRIWWLQAWVETAIMDDQGGGWVIIDRSNKNRKWKSAQRALGNVCSAVVQPAEFLGKFTARWDKLPLQISVIPTAGWIFPPMAFLPKINQSQIHLWKQIQCSHGLPWRGSHLL